MTEPHQDNPSTGAPDRDDPGPGTTSRPREPDKPHHTRSATACTTEQTVLGEGVRWDARRDELLRVDILAGRVYRDRIAEDGAIMSVAVYDLPGTVGAVAPIDGHDGWLLASGRGFVHLRPDGSWRTIAQPAPAGTRMNDAACDPQGRLWADTLADDHHAGGGALYRLDERGEAEQMLGDLTIPNGVGWSVDGTVMYLVDSVPGVVYTLAFDAERGTISDRCVLITVPPDEGAPDGLTLDAAGDLWVAIYGGGQVRRYSPSGELRETITVPAEQTTSCGFAGPALRWLYVTTATENWTDEQRRERPQAGLLYRCETGVTGLPAAPYRPDADRWTKAAG